MTDTAAVRNAAVALLARREHSRLELQQKLQHRFAQSDVTTVLDELAAAGLQSDNRFCEVCVRSKAAKGPHLIRQWLYARGVSTDLIDAALNQSSCNWLELAQHSYNKKFGHKPVADNRDKTARMRFLLGRGFDAALVRQVVG